MRAMCISGLLGHIANIHLGSLFQQSVYCMPDRMYCEHMSSGTTRCYCMCVLRVRACDLINSCVPISL